MKESITILSPDGQANVIASSEPLDSAINSAEYAREQGELLGEKFPGYTQLHYAPVDVFGGHPGYYRSFQWTPPDNVPVSQFQLYLARNSRGYTATATTGLRSAHIYQDILIAILRQLFISEEDLMANDPSSAGP
ncbi:DcrB-related protein [Blastococcus mobilis]|uniref:DcrB-related protein n=1 Tax=Blastococcus mobilis TaxID=1938746 RepID=UPI001595F655